MDDLNYRLEVTFSGEKKTLFMSYLRLNSCLRVLGGDATNIAVMMVDPDLSENIIRVMVADKGGAGEMFEVVLNEADLEPEEVDKILLWVQRHVTAFFMKRFQQAAESAAELEPQIAAHQSSGDGSSPSTSKTASAGPSD